MKVQGTHIHVGYFDDDNVFHSFAYAKQASVDMSTDMIEVSSPTSGTSKEFIPGRDSWTMSCDCLLSSDEQLITDIYLQKKKIKVAYRSVPPGLTVKKQFIGYAYIKALKSKGDIHSMASFSVSLQGTGPLAYGNII